MDYPYTEGSQLSLFVHASGRDGTVAPGPLTVDVVESMASPTMSVVLKVTFSEPYPSPRRHNPTRLAVLKLYDRRFTPSLHRKYNQSYDEDGEDAWREYVGAGKAPALFAFLKEKTRRREEEEGVLVDTDSETDSSSTSDGEDEEYDNPPPMKKKMVRTAAELREKKGGRESIIQWKAHELFTCETRAYAKLSHLQGRYISKLLAQVHLVHTTMLPAGASGDDVVTSHMYYNENFDIGGILLEYINGFNLTNLGSPINSVPKEKFPSIVQLAVDAAEHINNAGVINLDCHPRNVVVERETLRPFHIDFAQCLFVEDLGCDEFRETARRLGNQRAIESVMAVKLRRQGVVNMPEVRYDRCRWLWGLVGNACFRSSLTCSSRYSRWGVYYPVVGRR